MPARDWKVFEHRVLDSTNLEARRLLAKGYGAGLVVVARHQTAGRGRMGRGWLDRPGKSLLVSLILEEMEGFRAGALAAVSARAAVMRLGGSGPLLKWPNDLVYGPRKVGGILSELAETGRGRFVVVGLGLNVTYLPGELEIRGKLPPTSLLIEEGMTFDAEELLRVFLDEMGVRMGEGDAGWMEEYRAHLAYRGEEVAVTGYTLRGEGTVGARREWGWGSSRGTLSGILAGVDDGGYLLLRVGRETLAVASGDLVPLSRPGDGG